MARYDRGVEQTVVKPLAPSLTPLPPPPGRFTPAEDPQLAQTVYQWLSYPERVVNTRGKNTRLHARPAKANQIGRAPVQREGRSYTMYATNPNPDQSNTVSITRGSAGDVYLRTAPQKGRSGRNG